MADIAQIETFLEGMDYPCTKDDLIEYARDQGAGEDVTDALQTLPRETFDSADDVRDAIGGVED